MSKYKNNSEMPFVFFGTPEMATWALDEMEQAGLLPALVVTAPDARAGRGRVLTVPPVKLWAQERNIDILQPERLDADFIAELGNTQWPLFVVFAYGKILPQALLDIPEHGTLNIHPSLLPKLRGPSPVRSALLRNEPESVGVTIIELDKKMDHGPIVAQARVALESWPIRGSILDELLSREGGRLLSEALIPYLNGDITPEPQQHDEATFCTFLQKSDGELDLSGDGRENYLTFCAADRWPGAYYFDTHNKRIKVTEAHLNDDDTFIIDNVVPEGKREMSYAEYLRGVQS